MLEKYIAAQLAVATESPCCRYGILIEHKKLVEGIEHAQKSLLGHSPLLKSFHRFKAIEKLNEVALQDIYPKGRRYALLVLSLLH